MHLQCYCYSKQSVQQVDKSEQDDAETNEIQTQLKKSAELLEKFLIEGKLKHVFFYCLSRNCLSFVLQISLTICHLQVKNILQTFEWRMTPGKWTEENQKD